MKGRREGRDNRKGFYKNKLIATMIIVMEVAISINSADNKTEFGVMDDFTVWGVEGTLADPDLEIKGFSVFGATQTAYTANITNSPGNVIINGVLGVSSGAYIAGISTISYIANINTTSMTITGNGITGSSPIFKVAGSTMVILNDGNVGIGMMSPNNKLHISGLADGQGITIDEPDWTKRVRITFREGGGTTYGGYIGYDGGTDGMYINTLSNSVEKTGIFVTRDNGNVGIGTTDPQVKLEVNGDVKFGCPSGMVDTGAGYCMDSSDSTETAYGSSFATCANAGKEVCSFSQLCTAKYRGIGSLGTSYRVSDLMFYTGNNTHYFGGSGGANALNMPAACNGITAPGPNSGTFNFRCCRTKG